MTATPVFPHPPVVGAEYGQQVVPDYAGNPIIEALPPINDPASIPRVLRVRPGIEPSELEAPWYVRTHCVGRLAGWTETRSEYLPFENALSEMIRRGYVGRDPTSPTTMKMLMQLAKRDRALIRARTRIGSNAGGMLLHGLSGVGKSRMVESLLALYPQVIEHLEYKGEPFLRKQIVYLIVSFPSGASARALCLKFFEAVDEVIGTDYYDQWSKSRQHHSIMLIEMAKIAATHCIGVLVFDEIQHLAAHESAKKVLRGKRTKDPIPLTAAAQELMNFFVDMVNYVGVPLLFIGTHDVLPMFEGTLQYIRRSTSNGEVQLLPLERDSTEWNRFVRLLWKYQWVRQPLALQHDAFQTNGSVEQAVSRVCHDLTCGIPDFLVKLFMQANFLALRSGVETITPELLAETYKAYLRPLHAALDALRGGSPESSELYEKLLPDAQGLKRLEEPPASDASRNAVTTNNEVPESQGTKDSRKPEKGAKTNSRRPKHDMPSQVDVTPDQTPPSQNPFDLRTLAGTPDPIASLRSSGLVLDIRKLVS